MVGVWVALGGGNGGMVGVWGQAGMWGALGTGGKWHLQPSLPPPPFVSPFLGAHEGDNGGTSAAGTVGWHGVVAAGGTMSSPPMTCPPPLPPQAVCCKDHQHCCPQGYTCDIATQSCEKL